MAKNLFEVGVIKWLKPDSHKQRYGFILCADRTDLYFHEGAFVKFKKNGRRIDCQNELLRKKLEAGSEIVFIKARGPHGIRAKTWGFKEDYERVLARLETHKIPRSSH